MIVLHDTGLLGGRLDFFSPIMIAINLKAQTWELGAQGACAPNFSQIISQSAPLQLKNLPVFVYEGAPEYMCPHLLNASHAPVCRPMFF